ncbi:hypothetical protein HAU32_07460 [Weissella confusa]|uniref:DUF1640 domain-containing protein n=1 Tax=Weissella fermenti TaxID=2987699 RepID=A0ABT6D284_9LACO|nr:MULTISPECIES: hypothetical protein [Weissella]MBJ7688811.1 hypothetical protein [Weissella confusa]MCW0927167.1 hypothetical protein [Weissella sp. LMG 11983]MDF9299609.1 hypothetical protein [Weissella sp. BK2]
MDEKYVTKAEFEKFQDEEFKPLREEVRELRVEFVSFRQEVAESFAKMRNEIEALNVRMDSLERKLDRSNKIMMWIAAVYAVPMLFMMYRILGNN